MPPAGAALSIEYTSGAHQGYVQFRDAMKAVDPSIQVCSGWGRLDFVDAMGSRPYDCLGTHSYSTPPADGTLTRYGNLQVAAGNRDRELADLRNRMATHFPDTHTRPDLLVTEYGTLNPNNQYEARLAHVVYLAGQVAGQLENNVRVSINSNTADLPLDDGTPDAQNLFGSPPEFIRTGRAEMLSMYGSMAGGHLITTDITGNPTLTAPNGTYAALRVVTSCRGKVTSMVVINRDATQAVTADVALPGQHLTGNVSVATLNGATVESFNHPDHPNDITIHDTKEKASGSVLRHAFEPHSVTLLRFVSNGRSC
jgi:alpha-N-arabinofuranosidase